MVWRLAPSVLSADLTRLGEQVREVAGTGLVDRIQIDVMDGMFVPNISFGPLLFEALARCSDLPLEGHLMIERPDRYFERFRAAGARSLIVHWETCPHLHRDVEVTTIHYRGAHAAAVKRAGFLGTADVRRAPGSGADRSIHILPRRCCDAAARPYLGCRQTRIH